jgi:hypothetical protein
MSMASWPLHFTCFLAAAMCLLHFAYHMHHVVRPILSACNETDRVSEAGMPK